MDVDIEKAVKLLRDFEKAIDANLKGHENQGIRGWLKIRIHNVLDSLGRPAYAIHEQNDPKYAHHN